MCSGIVVVLAFAALREASAQKHSTSPRASAEKAGSVRRELQTKTVLSQSEYTTTPSCTVQRVPNVCDRRRRTVLMQYLPMCSLQVKLAAAAPGLPGLEKVTMASMGPVAADEDSARHQHKAVHSNRSSASTQGLPWA